MAEGATNRAMQMHSASPWTRSTTMRRIYRRLDVRNRAGAVHLGQRLGLLSDAETPSAPPPGVAQLAEHRTSAWPALDIAA
jgi:hypothetical protein